MIVNPSACLNPMWQVSGIISLITYDTEILTSGDIPGLPRSSDHDLRLFPPFHSCSLQFRCRVTRYATLWRVGPVHMICSHHYTDLHHLAAGPATLQLGFFPPKKGPRWRHNDLSSRLGHFTHPHSCLWRCSYPGPTLNWLALATRHSQRRIAFVNLR